VEENCKGTTGGRDVWERNVRRGRWEKTVRRRRVGRSVRKKCRGEMLEEDGGRKL